MDDVIDLSSAFSDFFDSFRSWFRDVFNLADSVIIFGGFSVLDFILVFIVLEIIISGLFVTFNTGKKSDFSENKKT